MFRRLNERGSVTQGDGAQVGVVQWFVGCADSGDAELVDGQSGVVGALHEVEDKTGTLGWREGEVLLM